MTKIVAIKNGFYAAGANALVQEVMDVGDCPGMLPSTVASTLLLPTNWNGLGAPLDKTMGIVIDPVTKTSGIYRYQEQVDGQPFDHWLDSKSSIRGVTYWRTSDEPRGVRISVLNGDTAADILASFWLTTLSPGSTMIDVGSGLNAAIRLQCPDLSNMGASLAYLIGPITTPDPLLLITKLSGLAPTSPSRPGFSSYIQVQDSTPPRLRRWNMSWTANGFVNQVASALTAANGNPMGPGYAHVSPFERMDFHGALGFPFRTFTPGPGAGLVQSASGALPGVSFDRGYIPGETEIDTNSPQTLESAADNRFAILSATGTGLVAPTSIDIQEFHALRILTP